jgi:hypothetical protein
MSLEQQLKQVFPWLTDRDFGHHATDLYVVAYPKIDKWLQDNYQFYSNVTQFIGNPEDDWNGAGKRCLEIPFAGEWKRLERMLKKLEQQSEKE